MGDMDFLLKCQIAFNEELQLPASDDKTEVANRIAMQSTYIWNASGPVATAGFRIVTDACACIVSVYVAPEHRRRGYASALTHAVTEHAQRFGHSTVFLFTDAEDEAPNIVYTRLGYVRVGEYADYRFGDTR